MKRTLGKYESDFQCGGRYVYKWDRGSEVRLFVSTNRVVTIFLKEEASVELAKVRVAMGAEIERLVADQTPGRERPARKSDAQLWCAVCAYQTRLFATDLLQ